MTFTLLDETRAVPVDATVAAADRARELRSLDAPDFTLPDLDGRLHGLADHRGKKILLIAFASW